ncbi:glycine cleavage system protein GcvH [Streptomyces olivochromogenes]|uniref:glycine cleavage system protein GcvH n=1 Tax=Streptomyces olivochromogenes TaxID=1963 RepID=UPI001F2751B2|nr:glycine cleavage system protein GcvH [Streptomyces olivochromogenes]MCF3131839.1 glycine cleavage system protein GcvH [Streptomyces olivochromogenes]
MSDIPSDFTYTKEHEWVQTTGNGRVRIGITDHAQKQLGDLVYVELPKVGAKLEAGNQFGLVESVKSVSDIFAPLTGTVAAVNEELEASPELVNEDPYDEGWLVELTTTDTAELKELLTAAQYKAYIQGET